MISRSFVVPPLTWKERHDNYPPMLRKKVIASCYCQAFLEENCTAFAMSMPWTNLLLNFNRFFVQTDSWGAYWAYLFYVLWRRQLEASRFGKCHVGHVVRHVAHHVGHHRPRWQCHRQHHPWHEGRHHHGTDGSGKCGSGGRSLGASREDFKEFLSGRLKVASSDKVQKW